MVSFEKLHDGTECECLNQEKVEENITDTFARRIRNIPPQLSDFASYLEENPKRFLNEEGCKLVCMNRGVSMNLLDGNNDRELFDTWTRTLKFRPRNSSIVCKFRIKQDQGLVWNTRNENNPSHRTLLRSDDFDITGLEVIETFQL